MTERPARPARLPVPAGVGRGVVLLSVFVCAACGLVYELELVALASYLVGDSVTHASVVLSVMVFAMGVGSLLAKRLRCCAAVGFGVIEALLALAGGGSAMALYAAWAWFGASSAALVLVAAVIGVLIGAEMPLLMTLIQRIRAQDAGVAVADLFAADYVGALAGGLAFPFLLLPFFGQLTGTLLTGVVNALAGGVVVLWLFRRDLTARGRWALLAVNAGVLALLVLAGFCVGPFERAAQRAVYGADVRVAVDTGMHRVVLTGRTGAGGRRGSGTHLLELFVDGRLRLSSADEERYHEALVHPALTGGPSGRVLVLGAGDGLVLREILDRPGVREVTLVARDPGVVALGRTDPVLTRLNRNAHRDPRVRVVTGDAFRRLRDRPAGAAPYDVVVCDLPDPRISTVTRFYSREFHGLVARALAPDGRLVVHAGSLTARPRDFWTVEATLRAAGLRTTPYTVSGRVSGRTPGPGRTRTGGDGPGPRDWGFVLAHRGPGTPPVRLGPRVQRPRLGALSPGALRSAVARADRARPRGAPPASTLMRPRFVG
ncbi:polyamine aminopropyltransferase [Streptomyces sp. JJ36]|uniref:polyamine aminopropyltransferase n=1 Tax=Streptomyces sp. JJ36 TaxID=2736645 RepID=UPI001EFF928B|nr:polyamine aminopropyltransferase [Streptomyces sp. JJ36]MCF6525898.1 polyamine aminopropyltransferase [Streptomyces sp. JJ36]